MEVILMDKEAERLELLEGTRKVEIFSGIFFY